MSDEASYSITKNFHTVRGDSLAEFQQNIEALLGAGAFERVATSFQDAFGVGEKAALATVVQAFPQSQPVTSVVGGVPAAPLPQPGTAAPSGDVPPGVANPGPCTHGPRVWKDTNTAKGQWRRWDCAMPYTNETKAFRCKSVNA